MKRLACMSIVALLVGLLIVPAARAGGLQVGQGQGVFDADEAGKIDMSTFPDVVESAYRKALEQYGEGAPKMILILANLPAGQGRLIKFVHDKLAPGVPLYGVGMGSYSIAGHEGFLDVNQPGITVLALGGDVEVQTATVTGYEMPVKDWDFPQTPEGEAARAESRAQHAAWGRQLAGQVHPVAGKTNVFFQLGTQHTPRMTWTTEGVVEVLPKDVFVIGSAASDFGYIIDKGQIHPHALLGILVSGDFKVVMAGCGPAQDDDQRAATFRQRLESLIAEAGRVPDLTVYVGCAGWRGQLPEQHQAAEDLLGEAPLLGSFAGGEIGRYETAGETVSLPGQLMLMGIVSGD